MFTLLLVTSLPACEKPRTGDGSGDEPAVPETAPVPEAALAPALPASGPQAGKAPPVVATRKPDSLDLSIKDRPIAVHKSPVLGAVPDSGWLDTAPEASATATGQNGLLPDLFDEQERDKPVSVKGKMLVDDGTQGISNVLDGAEMSVEIQTD